LNDLLRPELKGRKLAVDIRPKDVAGLVPGMGRGENFGFARSIAAQQPIWVRGGARIMIPLFRAISDDDGQ